MADDVLDHPGAAIARGDLAIFRIAPEMPHEDRSSSLAIQNVVRQRAPGYAYLEVGSAPGGSLLPHLADPACRIATSVDPRPASQPDERGRSFDYRDVSMDRMRTGLAAHLPPASMSKLRTLELTASQLTPAQVDAPYDLILIDAEHTNIGLFRDFLSVRSLVSPNAIIAFQDAHLLFSGLMNIAALLRHEGAPHRTLFLPRTVFVVLLGTFAEAADATLASRALNPEAYVTQARQTLWQEIALIVSER